VDSKLICFEARSDVGINFGSGMRLKNILDSPKDWKKQHYKYEPYGSGNIWRYNNVFGWWVGCNG
jgi:hypothetical protein